MASGGSWLWGMGDRCAQRQGVKPFFSELGKVKTFWGLSQINLS